MKKCLVFLGLLVTHVSADEMRQLCTQQADLVEFMMTVRADGFPRQGAEAELQKRYPTAPAGLLATRTAATLTEIQLQHRRPQTGRRPRVLF